MNMTRQRVAERWGLPFWELLKDFADQGLSRFDTARALGYRPDSFCTLLSAHPRKDPFEPSNKPLAYLLDTGETFGEAVERMAAAGMTVTEVALAIGYSCPSGLRHAMRARDIVVEFRRPSRKPRRTVERGPNMQKGWPTWEQVYAMGRKHGPV
jgi:AraC-like DNA-binding protein